MKDNGGIVTYTPKMKAWVYTESRKRRIMRKEGAWRRKPRTTEAWMRRKVTLSLDMILILYNTNSSSMILTYEQRKHTKTRTLINDRKGLKPQRSTSDPGKNYCAPQIGDWPNGKSEYGFCNLAGDIPPPHKWRIEGDVPLGIPF